jgi:cytochrome c oxidase subunit 2
VPYSTEQRTDDAVKAELMFQVPLADMFDFWLPKAASANAEVYDALFYFILWINIIFSSLIMAILVVFVVKYRHRKGARHDPTAGHSTALELTWTVIPTLIVLGIFYYGFKGYLHANTIPRQSAEVTANGSMWSWSFKYPNGLNHRELHMVAGQWTRVTLNSEDVIHDLAIPSFRMKKDDVPGRYNQEWFEPSVPNKMPEKNKDGDYIYDDYYQIYCAMYCGQNHSIMLANCVVHPSQADFDAWMAREKVWEPRMSYIERGKELYGSMGCAGCHSVTGPNATSGPTWVDMYGSQVPLDDGSEKLADDEYIRESIIDPNAKIVRTYARPSAMPPGFKDKLTENDIKALTWYMRSISSHYPKDQLTEGLTKGAAMKKPGTKNDSSTTAPSATQPAATPAAPH